jgi:two-component system, OmpR family, alkaline phosphatase synthesis response regulator PhoP
MSRVLVIEDNRNLADGLKTNLECEGHETDVAPDGSTGLTRARTGLYDLVILDLMLPGVDGYRVLEGIRDGDPDTPIIVLTARADEEDKVRGLGLGADDYVTKPFGLRELLARVSAQLRRAGLRQDDAALSDVPDAFGSIRIDASTHRVYRDGVQVPLRPKEYDLLIALLRRRNRVATRVELLQEVWGYHESVTSRTLDTNVAELRRKLEDDPAQPRWIITVRKTGYMMQTEGPPP